MCCLIASVGAIFLGIISTNSFAYQVVNLPPEYIVYNENIGSKSSCLLSGDTLYFVVSTDEDIKIQELITDTGMFKKQSVLAIDLNTNNINIVGNPGSYKADGYTLVGGLMCENDQLYVKTSNRYNVYDTKTYALIRNCSSDVPTNSYSILHNGYMYSTSQSALDAGVDKIGVILKEEVDEEFKPDTKFTQPKYFLPYNKYVRLFGIDNPDSLRVEKSNENTSRQMKYMKEAYRSEFIVQDWVYLVINDSLYAASAFGTDFYVLSEQGDSLSMHALNRFKSVRSNELLINAEFIRTTDKKFSRLAKMLYDKDTNNILFYYKTSFSTRVNKDDIGYYVLWSLTENNEITDLRPIDYAPLRIENNVITGIKVINDNDLHISDYNIQTN